MVKAKGDENFPPEEAERRMEAALKGAKIIGHKPMKPKATKRTTGKGRARVGKGRS